MVITHANVVNENVITCIHIVTTGRRVLQATVRGVATTRRADSYTPTITNRSQLAHKRLCVQTQTAPPMKIETLQFHPPKPAISDDIAQKLAAAEAAIYRLFQEGRPAYFGFSGGKDSSVCVDIGLRAARRFKADGGEPVLVVGTSDTLVENPEISNHYRSELNKMGQYARRHGLNLRTAVVKPTLASTWQVKILSGRGIPSFPGGSADCSADLKGGPQKRFRKNLFAYWLKQGLPEPVTVLGMRLDESVARGNNMRARGDNAIEPVRNKAGELVLSPIADWSEDDVFEHLGNISNGLLDSYSDMIETDRIYAHSAGTSCSVVAMDEHQARKSKGCGARHGCHSCQRSEDKSLEAMIAFDPRYAYAQGLNKLNKLIRATRYDWSRRHWIGRTIKGGWIEIKPDTYHPKFLRELTRYMLQLDHDEEVRARRAGEPPKFKLLPLDMMIAVDAMQSLNGVARPFQVWADYRDIQQRGIRYDIPEVPTTPAQPMPKTRYLYVGTDWDETGRSNFSGLRDDYIEGIVGDRGCVSLTELKDGTKVWDVNHELQFGVDMEAAMMLEDYELDRIYEHIDERSVGNGVGFAYQRYVLLGVLTLSHGQLAKHDEVLRRTAFKDRQGLSLEYSVDDLLARSVSFEELPPEAQHAWRPAKKDTAVPIDDPRIAAAAPAPTEFSTPDAEPSADLDEEDLADDQVTQGVLPF